MCLQKCSSCTYRSTVVMGEKERCCACRPPGSAYALYSFFAATIIGAIITWNRSTNNKTPTTKRPQHKTKRRTTKHIKHTTTTKNKKHKTHPIKTPKTHTNNKTQAIKSVYPLYLSISCYPTLVKECPRYYSI